MAAVEQKRKLNLSFFLLFLLCCVVICIGLHYCNIAVFLQIRQFVSGSASSAGGKRQDERKPLSSIQAENMGFGEKVRAISHGLSQQIMHLMFCFVLFCFVLFFCCVFGILKC
jgi:hypothetical protein